MNQEESVKKVLKHWEEVKQKRRKHEVKWKQIAEYFMPDASILGNSEEDRKKIFDSTPEDANETLAAALHSLLTNPAYTWFAIRMLGKDLENKDLSSSIELITEKIMSVFNSQKSGFNEQIHQMYLKLSPFGNGVVYSEEDKEAKVLFTEIPVWSVSFDVGAKGKVNQLFREFTYTAAQMIEKFGEKSVSKQTREDFAKNPNTEVKVLHAVYPKDLLGEEKLVNDSEKPFISRYIEIKENHSISIGGYYEFPYHVSRWLINESVYGRGPGSKALPDAKSLNAIERDSLIASEKIADPPTFAPDEAFTTEPSSEGGTFNYYRQGLDKSQIFNLPIAANLQVYDHKSEQKRNAVKRAFLNDKLQMMGGPKMTATEVVATQDEKMRLLGPVLGRLQSEFLASIVERVFNILVRQGEIKLPDEGVETRIEYVSPITRAQKQTEAQSFLNALGFLGPVLQASPSSVQNFDFDEIVRSTQKIYGYPSAYLRPLKDIQEEREAQAGKAAKQEEMAEAGETLDLAEKAKGQVNVQ